MKLPDKKKYEGVPGWEIVWPGLQDIANGKYNTRNALLVLMASPRLRFNGFDIPKVDLGKGKTAHMQLYSLFTKRNQDAHSQYNALQRRLVSFCSILESPAFSRRAAKKHARQ